MNIKIDKKVIEYLNKKKSNIITLKVLKTGGG